jgi:hypothetical protein
VSLLDILPVDVSDFLLLIDLTSEFIFAAIAINSFASLSPSDSDEEPISDLEGFKYLETGIFNSVFDGLAGLSLSPIYLISVDFSTSS